MSYTFQEIIPVELLKEYIALWGHIERCNAPRFNQLVEEFEENLLPKLNGKQLVDLIKEGIKISIDRNKSADKKSQITSRNLFALKGCQESYKNLLLSTQKPNKYFVRFSEEEEQELIEILKEAYDIFGHQFDVKMDLNDISRTLTGRPAIR